MPIHIVGVICKVLWHLKYVTGRNTTSTQSSIRIAFANMVMLATISTYIGCRRYVEVARRYLSLLLPCACVFFIMKPEK